MKEAGSEQSQESCWGLAVVYFKGRHAYRRSMAIDVTGKLDVGMW